MMRQIYHKHAWLVAVFIVAIVVVGTTLSFIDFGNLRYFNASLLTLTWGAWMFDYVDARAILYRRQRRLRLAFAGLLASGAYGSLDAALNRDHSPTLRVILVSITGGALLVSILFHPDDDLQIPAEVVFPWERWFLGLLGR